MLLDRDASQPYATMTMHGNDQSNNASEQNETAQALKSAPDTDEKQPTNVADAEPSENAAEDVEMADAPEAR